jgi:hypothetical protein
MQGSAYPVVDDDGDQVGAVLVHDAIGGIVPG